MNVDRDAIASRLSGTPLVLLLDIDGTISAIAPRPVEATVLPTALDALRSLVRSDGVVVGLVSGRMADDVRRMVPIEPVWVIGNHGAEIVSPDGQETVEPSVAAFEGAVAAARRSLEASGVAVEDKRWTLTVHYRATGIEPREVVSRVAAEHGLVVVTGKKVLELRPPVTVNKGTAAVALVERLGGFRSGASILYAGDDATDEDAFVAIRSRDPRPVTLHVAGEGSQTTCAEYIVADPMEMGSVLAWLAELRR
ncbi:MAG TPA: trehalose-phosphatase [Gemmatimonadaceae bacterium]|nr:trehalose-phosphatase [Gemmatimonadaceae bacterium]